MQTNQLQKMELEIVQAANGSSMYIDISTSLELNSVLTVFSQKLRDLPTPANTPTLSFELPLSDKSIRLNDFLEPLLTAAGR